MKNILIGGIIGLTIGLSFASGTVRAAMNTIGTGLYWDDTNQWLGIGVLNPTAQVDALGSIKSGATVYSKREAIGTTTPIADFQAATSTANATSSIVFGKSGQNKGECTTHFRTDGTALYEFIPAAAVTPTYTTTKPSGCQN